MEIMTIKFKDKMKTVKISSMTVLAIIKMEHKIVNKEEL
jgi:hypothetical protein